ncbi:MAG: lysylphosphatidylglycerol synthase domain-containing protein [Pyrinomonadaceae bacterium]
MGPDTDQETRDKDRRSKNKKIFIAAQAIGFISGLALLFFLIYKTGHDDILGSIARVGWGFLAVVGLNLSRHLLRALSLYIAVGPEHRTFHYSNVVAARFGGEAINFFSFTGPFLGDAAKAVMLRSKLPMTHGASAIIIDNILYYLTVIIMVLVGVATLVIGYGSHSQVMSNVLIAIVAVGAILFLGPLIAIQRRIKPMSFVIRTLARRSLVPRFLLKRLHNIHEVETNVFEFYHHRPADFFIVFGISVFVHVVSVTEVYLVMNLLEYDARVSTAFVIESLTKVINAVFGFIPGTIGVYEGGNGLILKALGYTAAMGITLAIVRRGAILITTFIGLLVLLWKSTGTIARRRKQTPA